MVNTEQNIAKLEKLLEQIEPLRQSNGFSIEFKKWKRDAENTLRHIYGESSHYFKEFIGINFGIYNAIGPTGVKQRQATYSGGLDDVQILIQSIIEGIKDNEGDKLDAPNIRNEDVKVSESQAKNTYVFIGHGRSALWARLKIYLHDELGLETIFYESESRVGHSIVPILEGMLNQATFAVLVLTAEDETAIGYKRARQNVIHEAGLFQGKLGFAKAVLLVQEGLEEFTNVAGLQHIPFNGDRIDSTFYELRKVLEREKQLK